MRAKKRAEIIEKMRMILPPISETPIPLHSHPEDDNTPSPKRKEISEEVPEISLVEPTNENEESSNKPEATIVEAEGEHENSLQIVEKFQCGECGKMFLENELLKKHWKGEHVNPLQIDENYQCGECEQMFLDNELLKKHWENEHENTLQIDENYQCGECGKMFLENELLKKHMDLDHIKEIQEQGNIVYLTPDCIECPKMKKDVELAKKMFKTSTESNHEEIRENSRQIDNLERRNEKLKETVDDLKKENKNYCKRVKDLTTENTKLHENAKNDAEVIDDTISQNFVLQEELKVIKESKDVDALLSDQEVSCKECE